ncbi:MAG: nucleotide sugar dehydrogenase [Planctomycetota bacterium]
MKISIFGMGYVGVVSGACFAKEGHEVVGVDLAPAKVELLNQGQTPIVEEGMAELVREVCKAGRLRATQDARAAVLGTDLSLISVGTPSRPNGSLNLDAVAAVSREIGTILQDKQAVHTVIVRSTLMPGSTRSIVIPALEETSGKRCGEGFHVCYNPEFLREGSSIKDFYSAPYTVLGEASPEGGTVGAELYSCLEVPLHRCAIEVAEALKYVSNTWHALKVAFANEAGVILKQLGVDSHAALDLAWKDTKLNISPAYLRPGYAFGGSCLPKDVRALVYAAKDNDIEIPLLSNLMRSNEQHIDRAVRLVLDEQERDIALLGLSFKAGTDDLRESPLVTLAERLIGKGCRLRIYDPDVALAQLTGANRAYIEKEIPHIGDLLSDDLSWVLEEAKVAVVGNVRAAREPALAEWVKEGTLIDLQRVAPELAEAAKGYKGICW